MDHVWVEEGTPFIPRFYDVKFTEEERLELEKIKEEVKQNAI